ncbi:4555_t:CDS:1 [Acaulospora colombiana]|uniref:4555_t:CDS:1 n=1 Tax=Acaulospora colombiana TaxID=27376 RepID=A0ACA9PW15_9GLOM|nr:4555_t:CDS:1 [Acaulospora colombiana]
MSVPRPTSMSYFRPSARRPTAIDTRSSRDRRPPLNGPPPPPSWLNPNRRQRNNQQSTRSTPRTAQASSSTRAEPSSIRGAGMSKKERKQRKEEEAMDKAYGNEYWYRRADDARWTEWREKAMSLVLGRRASSFDSEDIQRSSRMFVPFKVAHDTEGVPSLFETTLKYICDSIATASGEGSDYDNDIIVDVFSSLPPHLRKSLLRYMAVHHPQSEPQLRRIYALSREEPLIQEQGGLEPEIIISGKHLDAGILDRLNQPLTSKESTIQASVSLLQEAKTIILFQISSLQKRQLLSFPKTLTTLGLIQTYPYSPLDIFDEMKAITP